MSLENETLELLKWRRSVRAYSSEPITEDIKDLIINRTIRAPTGGNMMTYTIIEIKNQETKEKLVTTCNNLKFIAKSPYVLLFVADMQRWYDYYLQSGVPQLCKDLNIPFKGPKMGDMLLACADALIAAQTAVIAAESLGIGSCYIGDIMEHIEIHRDLFNLPRWTLPLVMVCFGYPKKKGKPLHLSPRYDKEFIHHIDTYRRLTENDFSKMHGNSNMSHLHPNAENLGQHYYLVNQVADYIVEMNRSMALAVQEWMEADPH